MSKETFIPDEERYPELTKIVDRIENEMAALVNARIPHLTNKVESEMRYKQQFVLEKVILRVTKWEDKYV